MLVRNFKIELGFRDIKYFLRIKNYCSYNDRSFMDQNEKMFEENTSQVFKI
jgi:hypothetical protein